MNTVCIGDVDLLTEYDSTIKFNGVDSYATTPVLLQDTFDGTHTVWCTYNGGGGYTDGNVVAGSDPLNMGGFEIRYDVGNNQWCLQYMEGGNYRVIYSITSDRVVIGQKYKLAVNITGTTATFIIDDVVQGTLTSFQNINVGSSDYIELSGRMQDSTRMFIGTIDKYMYVTNTGNTLIEYDMLTQFGSSQLLDSSGNGNDAQLTNCVWLRHGIDEVFSSPTAYKASWDIPMNDDQLVHYTTGTPVYAETNSFWSPYKDDSTYTFTIDTTRATNPIEPEGLNRVCIGSLDDLTDYDSLLHFNGISSGVVSPVLLTNMLDGTHTVWCKYTGNGVIDGNVVAGSVAGYEGAFEIRYDAGFNKWCFQFMSGASYNVIYHNSSTVIPNEWYKLSVEISGSNVTFRVNDNQSGSSTQFINVPLMPDEYMELGGKTQDRYFDGYIEKYTYTSNIDSNDVEYDVTLQYDDDILIDHSGNGNDGVINNCMWSRDGVTAYSTPYVYKDTLGSVLGSPQEITYTDSAPVYSEDDTFWNPFNQHPTYTFTVDITRVDTTNPLNPKEPVVEEVCIGSLEELGNVKPSLKTVDSSSRLEFRQLRQIGSTTAKKVVSYGLRAPTMYEDGLAPNHSCRLRRTALTDMSGTITAVLPTFHLEYINGQVEEREFVNSYRVQWGIEPLFKAQSTGLTEPRIVSSIENLPVGDSLGYILSEIDLGDVVIPIGQEYGIWCVIENLSGNNEMPLSRYLGSKQEQIYESFNDSFSSIIDGDFIGTSTSVVEIPLSDSSRRCYTPVVLLSITNDTTNSYGIYGSSIIEGQYDDKGSNGSHYGIKGSAAIYDKIFTGVHQQPSVNVARGQEKLVTAIDNFSKRMEIFKVCNLTHALCGLGSNDIENTTLTNMQRNTKTFNTMLRTACGEDLISITGSILPRSTSTDYFNTVVNQTPNGGTAGNTSNRGMWNNYIRSIQYTITPNEFGINGAVDVCTFVEDDYLNNNGLWGFGPNGETPNRYVYDGLHPTGEGSTAIAQATVYVEKFTPPNNSTLYFDAIFNEKVSGNLLGSYDLLDINSGYVVSDENGIITNIGGKELDKYYNTGHWVVGVLFDGTKTFDVLLNSGDGDGVISAEILNITGDALDLKWDYGGNVAYDTKNGFVLDIIGCNTNSRKNISRVFATPDDYKNSLGVMDNNQIVWYADDGIPYYPSDDIFWNPYNENSTYYFSVREKTYWSNKKTIKLLLLM